MTKGFRPSVRQMIIEREGGRCARCSASIIDGGQIHHRRPRGMGGALYREATNLPGNGVALCADCHRWVESERMEAMVDGWVVAAWRLPAEVPVLYRGTWLHLDDDGSIDPVEDRD
jgi:hypothetical protein